MREMMISHDKVHIARGAFLSRRMIRRHGPLTVHYDTNIYTRCGHLSRSMQSDANQ